MAATLLNYIQRSFAPRYNNSFIGVLVLFVVVLFVAQALRFALVRENSHRDRLYGPPGTEHGLEDQTDKENKKFTIKFKIALQNLSAGKYNSG